MSIKSKALIRAEKLLPGNQDFTSITDDIASVPEQKKNTNSMVVIIWIFTFAFIYFCWKRWISNLGRYWNMGY